MNDRDLAKQAQNGDRCAIAELLQRNQEVAFRAAFLVTVDAAEAEDAVQEGFFKAYRALGSFDPDRPFRPWLLRIVTNVARNNRRSATKRERLRLRLSESSQEHGTSADSQIIAAQQREAIMREVAQLPEIDRLALTYHYFLDLSIAEIAQLFDCPQSTIRSRLLRARARLRERLSRAENWPDEPHSSEGALL